jgi:hypothetical protein
MPGEVMRMVVGVQHEALHAAGEQLLGGLRGLAQNRAHRGEAEHAVGTRPWQYSR